MRIESELSCPLPAPITNVLNVGNESLDIGIWNLPLCVLNLGNESFGLSLPCSFRE